MLYVDAMGVGRMVRYVCLGCGFLEECVVDPQTLERIRAQWSTLEQMK